jgi:hypothetical protein
MSHLHDTHQSYLAHLFRAWKIAFILLVHGVLPNVWKNKASDLLCKERLGDDATRKYLLKTMWGIEEREGTPGVWDRLSDREVAAKIELGYIERAEKEKALQQPKKKKKKK